MCQTLHELLVRASETSPDRTAVVSPDASLSYVELFHNAYALAQSLIQAGVTPGDRVGLCLPKTCDAIVAVYGILLSGAAYVPIDPTAPAERAVRIALNVATRFLVTTPNKAEDIAPTLVESLERLDVFVENSDVPLDLPGCQVHSWVASDDISTDLPAVNENDLAYILHTSGSTGRPKGVAISHKSALTFVDMAADFFSIRENDRLCSQAPLHFDLSVFDLYVACRQRACVVLLPEFYTAFPKKYVSAIREHRITIWNSVSSALVLLIEKGQPDPGSLASVRLVLFSGEAMPAKYLRELQAYFEHAVLYNGYGQTEANTSMYFHVKSIPDNDWRAPIGKAFPNYEVFALDENGAEISQPGLQGELYVCSNAVADGYWDNPALTKSKFQFDANDRRGSTRVFRTGDTVCINDDGDFEFVGRADDMIKSRGYRVELSEIEQVLLSCPGVTGAVCIALPDDKITNRLFGIVACSSGSETCETEIVKVLRNKLPGYMVPEQFIVKDELPRASNGKIDRNRLREELISIASDRA